MQKLLSNLVAILLLAAIAVNAQSRTKNYTVLFKNGTFTPAENGSAFLKGNHLQTLPQFDGKYYAFVQFNETPTKVQRDVISIKGIELINYLPHYSYFVSIPKTLSASALDGLNIRHISALSQSNKLNMELLTNVLPERAIKVAGKIDLNVMAYSDVDFAKAYNELKQHGDIIQSAESANMFVVRVDLKSWQNISSLPFVYYVEPVAGAPLHDDTKGRSLHRSNTLNVINKNLSNGLHYDGTGVHVAIADDGSVSHIDFQGRFTDHTQSGQGGSHGDMTSGICAGAGNLNPINGGMATGSQLHVFDINGSSLGDYPQIVNAVANYANDTIAVVSTSYSQPGYCNTYGAYGNFADATLNQNPQLMFVFSAGNNNGANCNYGAGTQWANITGGYKASKLVTACANLDALEVLDNSSSRGPASDGRIKPDISANGKDQMSTDEANTYQVGGGTSASSPGIAGCYAQLYHAYRDLNGGSDPDCALLKACLLNTAEDIGNAGPDFIYGWGRVNLRKAYNVLTSGRYLRDSIDQGSVNTHSITVPSGVARIKAMIYWPDVAGSPVTGKALVNDIDITLSDGSTVYQPLVLDPTPTATALNTPAVPGVDTLNVAEQVLIDNPAAGTYTLTVTGTEIPMGPQRYFMTYEFYYDDITVTYPYGGEGFVPNLQELIRWDASPVTTGSFLIEHSSNSGLTWNTIATVAATAKRHYNWTVPNNVNGLNLIRVSRNGVSDVNDSTFSIIATPVNIHVNYVCPDSLNFGWNAVSNAIGYTVYMLGAKYMDVQGTTANLNFTITPYTPAVEHWVSVAAITPDNTIGRRALAIRINPGTTACPTGIDEIISESSFSVYPNPSNNMFYVDAGKFNENEISYVVTDAQGRNLLSNTQSLSKSKIFPLDFSKFASGIYFLRIKNDKNEAIRLIKF